MTKREFADYLNEKLEYYGLSEEKLAKAVGISQKTINRYRNEQTANLGNRDRIIQYFERVAEKQVRVGEKYVPKLSIEEILEEADDYDFRDNFSLPSSISDLYYFTPRAQDFIIDHLSAYNEMDDKERAFIKKVRSLPKALQDKLLAKLESIPVCMDMFMPDNVDEYGFIEEPCSPFSKAREYIRVMRELTYTRGNWLNGTNDKTNERNKVYIKDKRARFIFACEDLYMKGEEIKQKLFDVIFETTSFEMRDWYFLYLFNRCILSETYFREKTVDIDGTQYKVKENEYMIWKYLFFLES
jgi:transcriptional regulator with XRE-family HTH domain